MKANCFVRENFFDLQLAVLGFSIEASILGIEFLDEHIFSYFSILAICVEYFLNYCDFHV